MISSEEFYFGPGRPQVFRFDKMKGKTITTILKLVFAECRGYWHRLIFFIVCIAIGVGAVMSVKSFSISIANSIEKESKSLIASDVEIRGSWPLTNEELKKIKQLAEGYILIQTVVELKAMVLIDSVQDRSSSSMLVELKAVPEKYPYYGNMEVSPDAPFEKLLYGNNALVEDSFLVKNNLKIGDHFKLGESRLSVSGVIKREPDRAITVFNLGPRVMISSKILDETKLIQPGSRARYRTLIKIPEGVDVGIILKELKKVLAGSGVKIQSFQEAQPAIRESLKRFELFLGSIGVIALLVGGVGVAMIARTFLHLKLINIAILKCLGVQTNRILGVYLIQVMLLGLLGSSLGIVGGFGLQGMVASGISQYFHITITYQWLWRPALEAMTLGLVTTFIFSVWPLLNARRTLPATLLRQDDNERGSVDLITMKPLRKRWLFIIRNFNTLYPDRLPAAVLLGLGLAVITFWQAGSMKAGLIFFSGVIGAAAILIFITNVILKLLKKLPRARSIASRYGITNIYRPQSQAVSIVTAIGVGVMLILTVQLIQFDLLDYINKSAPVDAPNFFFIDIQPDQAGPFKKAVKKIPEARLTAMVPMIRSRLSAVAGKPIKKMKFDNQRTKRFFHREFVLTYSGTLPEENTIIEGKWWGKDEDNFPTVSVEKDAAHTLGISLGSQLTLSVQGTLVTPTVTSIRTVNWNNRRTNFYMILSPASVKGLSYNFVATAQVPEEDELALQTSVTESLSNVTAISTRQILMRAREVLDRVSLLVRMLSVFTIATGLVILSSAIASTKFRRMREAAILKTVGATKKILAGILGYEYLLLGLIAGGVGSLLSVLFSYEIAEHLIQIDWRFRPAPIIIAIMATVFLVWSVGLLSSWSILKNKPLQTLRYGG